MASFSLILAVIVAVIGVCDSKRTICPEYVWPLENTVVQNILNVFKFNTPADGVCPKGQEKYILYGGDFGYSTNRCVCLNLPESKYKKCGKKTPQCPAMPAAYENEIVGDFFLRMGSELKGGLEDGCCPAGSVRWIAESKYVGIDQNICFCVPQNDLVLQ